jgi:hydrogenase maturation protease
MKPSRARCLILGCGNSLRGDDGVGPWLCAWAERRLCSEPGVRVISRQQWTPELAEEIAAADAVVFIDCSLESPPGSVRLEDVAASSGEAAPATHTVNASDLLALARDLYGSLPKRSLLLTIGAGSMELGEEFSAPVNDALVSARQMLGRAVVQQLG